MTIEQAFEQAWLALDTGAEPTLYVTVYLGAGGETTYSGVARFGDTADGHGMFGAALEVTTGFGQQLLFQLVSLATSRSPATNAGYFCAMFPVPIATPIGFVPIASAELGYSFVNSSDTVRVILADETEVNQRPVDPKRHII